MKILLIDDQPIVAEAVKRQIEGESDIQFRYCSDSTEAMAVAKEWQPTLILQDIVMPNIDGLTLVKAFREEEAMKEVPIIVLSVEENPAIKAEAFARGANDYIVKLPDRLELLARIRYHSRAYVRLLERNAAYTKLHESQQVLESELAEAAAYVFSLFPPPMKEPFTVDWRFIPSMQLGGDAFGYQWIDDRFFAIYLFDVCGHGVGAALHSISIMNVLRSESLPDVDFHHPAQVLGALNRLFKMEEHHGMFLTIWYGVYDREKGEILYSNGGHPPPLLIHQGKEISLTHAGVAIGIMDDATFEEHSFAIEKGDTLFIFSDGTFEVDKKDGTGMMTLGEFDALLMKVHGLDNLVKEVQTLQGKESFVDDLSVIELTI